MFIYLIKRKFNKILLIGCLWYNIKKLKIPMVYSEVLNRRIQTIHNPTEKGQRIQTIHNPTEKGQRIQTIHNPTEKGQTTIYKT